MVEVDRRTGEVAGLANAAKVKVVVATPAAGLAVDQVIGWLLGELH
jgi:hypothetical protein